LGYFQPNYQQPFCTVSPLSIFSINQPLFLQKTNPLHCKCLQGFTGSLQGNQSAGISNLWGLPVTHNPRNFEMHRFEVYQQSLSDLHAHCRVPLRHRVSPYFLWGKNLQCISTSQINVWDWDLNLNLGRKELGICVSVVRGLHYYVFIFQVCGFHGGEADQQNDDDPRLRSTVILFFFLSLLINKQKSVSFE
jgi:hypothetical protein